MRKSLNDLVVTRKPYAEPTYDEVVVGAMRALLSHTANEGQQKTAVEYIINELCQYYDVSFVPGEGGRRDTDFAEGKRYVAAHIITLAKVVPGGKK